MKFPCLFILTVIFFTGSVFKVSGQIVNGRTTAIGYWDCCKPSCGWPGKAFVENPVNSCQKDGIRSAGFQEQSGCLGGTAFTCNDQQPFAASGHLAYAFAAAKIAGQSEKDWCCACYKLNFTSAPIRNQVLIVQVTNSASDLVENQFDLQFSGSGGRTQYGCRSQWGARSGGPVPQSEYARTRDDCFDLPPQIQQGCLFRFDWYKNAHEQPLQFERIYCPYQLLEQSECHRYDDTP